MIIYKLMLFMAFPVANIFNFRNKVGEIEEAIKAFNEKYTNKKQITLIEIGEDNLLIELKSQMELRNPTKEISAFSKILYHNYGWEDFSQVKSRLFNVRDITDSNSNKDMETYDINNIGLNSNVSKIHSETAFNMFAQLIMNEKDVVELDNYIRQLNKLLVSAKAMKQFLESEN
ncbi:hypothetical protein SAMN02745134_00946 [Clostridium acidisoli DSM 12555]|uniref:Uncharacterized protein n=1 Tax=Clostridium acidisoli DSM 12555 TaxID=1121291 RepID=A0A1W1X7J0_9CLOT|nr:hypothetical protein [Clostridium acidisoli]SMC19810.1 hypothetical protein SAMN02745134_00946 [Clostridium acidisoli DSM 12555]